MQTFLPYEDFQETASVLDYRRLGKQRVETWQLIRAINGETKGWANHPAAVMWRGHTAVLASYGLVMCQEWKRRGYTDNMSARFQELISSSTSQELNDVPRWLGRLELHVSHQSNLIRKFPEHYGPLFSGVPDDLPYIWPLTDQREGVLI